MSDLPAWLRAARGGWSNTGSVRPSFAVQPAAGQESVWDYPRPPAVVADRRQVTVGQRDDPLAGTGRALRVLETASPPTWYLPPDAVRADRLVPAAGRSFCEWKGAARYWALADEPAIAIGWDYPEPFPEFAALAGHLAFFPARIACWVGDERVRPQAGGFYGGWITDDVVGPFKGDPGTSGW
jgi:uncharacterized protein (DUF427 family)